MKKILLTAVVAFCTLFASAQIMVVTTYVDENDDGTAIEGADRVTQKMGIGYQVNDVITAGVQKDGDDFSLFVRYVVKDDIYATFNMPTKDGSDKAQVGLGYSMNIWNNVYFEPSYTMPIKETDGDREGSFNFGLAYRF